MAHSSSPSSSSPSSAPILKSSVALSDLPPALFQSSPSPVNSSIFVFLKEFNASERTPLEADRDRSKVPKEKNVILEESRVVVDDAGSVRHRSLAGGQAPEGSWHYFAVSAPSPPSDSPHRLAESPHLALAIFDSSVFLTLTP